MNSDIKALAYEVSYGATGKVRAQFIALAKANGYEGAAGGWIYRAGSTKAIVQGWAGLAARVLYGSTVLRPAVDAFPARPVEGAARKISAGNYEVTVAGWVYSIQKVRSEYGDTQWIIDREAGEKIQPTWAQTGTLTEAKAMIAATHAEPAEVEEAEVAAVKRLVGGEPIRARRVAAVDFAKPTVIDGFQVPNNAADTREWYSAAADLAAMYAEDDDSFPARNARKELRAARQAKERLA